jgi:hypothetical protein
MANIHFYIIALKQGSFWNSPALAILFQDPKMKKTALLQQNDKYGCIMLRIYHNGDNYL